MGTSPAAAGDKLRLPAGARGRRIQSSRMYMHATYTHMHTRMCVCVCVCMGRHHAPRKSPATYMQLPAQAMNVSLIFRKAGSTS